MQKPKGSIPADRILQKLDSLFARNDLSEAARLLKYWEGEAEELQDTRGLLTILSEEMGFYRRTMDSEAGLSACQKGLRIIETEGLTKDAGAATVMLNAATTMKCFGHAADAVFIYEMVLDTYKKQLSPMDYRFAGLYNNYASTLTELRRYDKAEKLYKDAVIILLTIGDHQAEIAVTYVNLAHLVCEKNIEDPEAETYMRRAWDILDSIEKRDGNYAFVCEKCAPSFGYFGFFLEEKELRERSEKIYKNGLN